MFYLLRYFPSTPNKSKIKITSVTELFNCFFFPFEAIYRLLFATLQIVWSFFFWNELNEIHFKQDRKTKFHPNPNKGKILHQNTQMKKKVLNEKPTQIICLYMNSHLLHAHTHWVHTVNKFWNPGRYNKIKHKLFFFYVCPGKQFWLIKIRNEPWSFIL